MKSIHGINLTWQHKDKVLVFHGICVQATSKEGKLFAICGDTKGNKKVVISCQILFLLVLERGWYVWEQFRILPLSLSRSLNNLEYLFIF
jgi:hypothetical protein